MNKALKNAQTPSQVAHALVEVAADIETLHDLLPSRCGFDNPNIDERVADAAEGVMGAIQELAKKLSALQGALAAGEAVLRSA